MSIMFLIFFFTIEDKSAIFLLCKLETILRSSSLQIFKASGEYKYLRTNPNLKTSCSETPVINNFPKREPIECQKSLSNQSQISDLEESQISDLEESQISGLEKSQAEALKNALTQEVSLIQVQSWIIHVDFSEVVEGPEGGGASWLILKKLMVYTKLKIHN